jgi:hypothetical protein
MCDYSLMTISSRLAVESEELAAHRFRTGSVGLVSILDLRQWLATRPVTLWGRFKQVFTFEDDVQPAVCIPPGARLRLDDIPKSLRTKHGVGTQEAVTFTQLSGNPGEYRDAIVFENGRSVLLQELEEGQRLRVLSLATDEKETVTPELDEAFARVIA